MKFSESSMGRSMELGKEYGFIILSACRSDWDLEDPKNNEKINKSKTKQLMSDIQHLGLSYIPVYGGYVEKGLGKVTEDSFFILNFDVKTKTYYSDMEFLRNVGIELCKEYNQDSFLFSPPNEKPYYIDKYGVEDTYKFGKIVFNAPTDTDHPYFTSFKKGGGGYDSKTGRFGKSDSRFRYESKGVKKMVRRMNEGAGAGYDVEIDGIELDSKTVKIIDIDNKSAMVSFDVNIKKNICEYWKASGYYEGVDSEGIYYDNELVMDYEKADRQIDGGVAHCLLDLSYNDEMYVNGKIDETKLLDYIKDYIPTYVNITAMYGGGWSHCNLDPKGFTLGGGNPYSNDITVNNESYDFMIDSADIVAPNMAEDVNWFFENCDDFERIFFGGDEE